ncbi:MAG: hypothetical protein LBD10_05000 [Desulfobulbus sp.]|jgi:hypothetical protein|uniref:hypothetical protein n=1 Tax=Desulfobulbus sp. TaxID=895 RepID=UPI0028407B9D|nr:hypothetical protein [Desulfobulbus sp.]MDR2549542.1 hypothetical protein [Desulfobulbus sp.]
MPEMNGQGPMGHGPHGSRPGRCGHSTADQERTAGESAQTASQGKGRGTMHCHRRCAGHSGHGGNGQRHGRR